MFRLVLSLFLLSWDIFFLSELYTWREQLAFEKCRSLILFVPEGGTHGRQMANGRDNTTALKRGGRTNDDQTKVYLQLKTLV